MTLTVGSLFSGIGGMDLGLERAGLQIAFQVEVDAYCRCVLAKHWPDVPRYGDIREVTGEQLGPCDVLAGGFPCQPNSVAGRRGGRSDDRWLWPGFARLVREVGPRFVLVENPTGLLTVDRGAGFGDILADLDALGFDAEWSVLSACAMDAPHTRERVFLMAYARRQHGQARGVLHRTSPSCSGWTKTAGERSDHRNFAELVPASDCRLRAHWWSREPAVDRMAHGIPARVDRVTALGNAVVPQVAEFVGRRILAAAQGDLT